MTELSKQQVDFFNDPPTEQEPFVLNIDDLSTWHREMALLSGVRYAGVLDPSA